MLAHLGEEDAAARIEAAVVKALENGKIRSLSARGMGTSEVGDWWPRSYNGGEVRRWR